MSGLIKADAAHSVRSFSCLPNGRSLTGRPTEVTTEIEDPQLKALRGEVETLQEALAQSAVTLDRAKAEEREAGKREAKEAFQRDETKQLQALNGAISAALQAWECRLSELDGLAAILSKTALSKVFTHSESRSELVLESIARQIQHLRRETILAVRVSRHDFPDEASLEAAAQTSGASVSVRVDADLESGDCRLDLQLGHLDVGPRAQWAQLAILLDDLVAGEDRG